MMHESIVLVGLMKVNALLIGLSLLMGMFINISFLKNEELGNTIFAICLIIAFFLELVLSFLVGYL